MTATQSSRAVMRIKSEILFDNIFTVFSATGESKDGGGSLL